MVENKRILILGAGRGQTQLINTAKEMGCRVIVTTNSDNYPGVELADEICYVDMSDPDAVLEKARGLNIDGIATSCNDFGIMALGKVCDELKLKGLSEEAAQRSNNKLLMKECLMQHGVPTAKFKKIADVDDLKRALNSIEFPVIIKAVDLQGSRGIYVCRTEKEAVDNFSKAMELTKKDFCIIEEFIIGYEFGAQAFVIDGEILFVLPHGDNTYMSDTAVPVGHYAPFDGDDDLKKQADEAVRSAIKAIGLDNCAVNVDLIVRDGKVYIIELTGRVGATCLPELVGIYYGIDYYKMIILTALGEDPRKIFEKRGKTHTANSSRMLVSEKTGVVKQIINNNSSNDKNIYEITFFIKEGDEVRKFTNANDCIAQVVVTGKDYEECDRKIEEIKSKIELILE